jgi:hypothetical protein
MATLTLTIRDENLKSELTAAFAAKFANPDNLSAEDLALKQLEAYALGVLNQHKEETAVEAARLSVVKEDSLS